MKRSLNLFAWYLVLVIAVLAAPAPAMVDSSYWQHVTGGVSPGVDVVVRHGLEGIGNLLLTVYGWLGGDS